MKRKQIALVQVSEAVVIFATRRGLIWIIVAVGRFCVLSVCFWCYTAVGHFVSHLQSVRGDMRFVNSTIQLLLSRPRQDQD